MIKNILVLLLILIPYISNSQSVEDIADQAASMGISTQSDVLNELNRRGMTEADARRMAAVYGISYDETSNIQPGMRLVMSHVIDMQQRSVIDNNDYRFHMVTHSVSSSSLISFHLF